VPAKAYVVSTSAAVCHQIAALMGDPSNALFTLIPHFVSEGERGTSNEIH